MEKCICSGILEIKYLCLMSNMRWMCCLCTEIKVATLRHHFHRQCTSLVRRYRAGLTIVWSGWIPDLDRPHWLRTPIHPFSPAGTQRVPHRYGYSQRARNPLPRISRRVTRSPSSSISLPLRGQHPANLHLANLYKQHIHFPRKMFVCS